MLWNRNDWLHFRFRLWKSFGSGSRQYLAQFPTIKIAQNLAFSMSEAPYFSESWPAFFDFFWLFYYILCWIRIQIRFMHSCPVPLKQKFTVPTVPVPA